VQRGRKEDRGEFTGEGAVAAGMDGQPGRWSMWNPGATDGGDSRGRRQGVPRAVPGEAAAALLVGEAAGGGTGQGESGEVGG
jgi:hypothetical protein